MNLTLAVLAIVLTKLKPGTIFFSFPNHELSRRKSQAVEIEVETDAMKRALRLSVRCRLPC